MRKRKEAIKSTETKFYVPGISPGKPFKNESYRICYTITKVDGKHSQKHRTDNMDLFLHQCDKKINHFEWHGLPNPYNPHNLVAEFDIRMVEDNMMIKIREQMK